jgi:hypothetical protein
MCAVLGLKGYLLNCWVEKVTKKDNNPSTSKKCTPFGVAQLFQGWKM